MPTRGSCKTHKEKWWKKIPNEQPAFGSSPNSWPTNFFLIFLHEPYMSLSCAWWKRYFFMIFKCFSLFSISASMCSLVEILNNQIHPNTYWTMCPDFEGVKGHMIWMIIFSPEYWSGIQITFENQTFYRPDFGCHLNSVPFTNQTTLKHSKYRQVWYRNYLNTEHLNTRQYWCPKFKW